MPDKFDPRSASRKTDLEAQQIANLNKNRGFNTKNLNIQRQGTTVNRDSEAIIKQLSEENRSLSENIENLEKEVDLLRQRSASTESIQKQMSALEQDVKVLQEKLSAQQDKNEKLEAVNRRLSAQKENQEIKALTSEEGSALINRTLESMAKVNNFKLVDANVKLKLATAKVGEEGTLVFPDPKSQIDPATLQEIEFKIVRDTRSSFF